MTVQQGKQKQAAWVTDYPPMHCLFYEETLMETVVKQYCGIFFFFKYISEACFLKEGKYF